MAAHGLYPRPIAGLPIVEPFAGAAGYSTIYGADRDVILIDANPNVVCTWKWLIDATPDDVLALPDIEVGQRIDELDVPHGAQTLMGWWLGSALAYPRRQRTRKGWNNRHGIRGWGADTRRILAGQVDRIKSWTVIQAQYMSAPDIEATWFVDPPYQGRPGVYYGAHGSHHIDFDRLGAWCRRLRGGVVVCENVGAQWLPFQRLARTQAARCTSDEAVWYGGRWVDG